MAHKIALNAVAVDIYGWRGEDPDDLTDRTQAQFEKLSDRKVYGQVQFEFEKKLLDTGVGEKESYVGYVLFRNSDLRRAGIELKRNFQLAIDDKRYRIVVIKPAAVMWKKPLMSQCYINEVPVTAELKEARLANGS